MAFLRNGVEEYGILVDVGIILFEVSSSPAIQL
jgi:hypothetical protein